MRQWTDFPLENGHVEADYLEKSVLPLVASAANSVRSVTDASHVTRADKEIISECWLNISLPDNTVATLHFQHTEGGGLCFDTSIGGLKKELMPVYPGPIFRGVTETIDAFLYKALCGFEDQDSPGE